MVIVTLILIALLILIATILHQPYKGKKWIVMIDKKTMEEWGLKED